MQILSSLVKCSAFCIAALLLSIDCLAASGNNGLPPPGLYRVDTEATISANHGATQIHSQRDGTTGTEMDAMKDGGKTVSQHQFAGKGMVTRCIGGANDPAVAEIAARGQKATGCGIAHVEHTADGVAVHSSCPSDNTVTMFHQIGAKTWEATTTAAVPTVAAGPAQMQDNLNGLRFMLENQLKYGSPSEQKEAAEKLAEFKQHEAEYKQQQAEMAAAMKQAQQSGQIPAGALAAGGIGAPAMQVFAKERLTRIADSCGKH